MKPPIAPELPAPCPGDMDSTRGFRGNSRPLDARPPFGARPSQTRNESQENLCNGQA
jgi:hypothetical protein